MTIIYHIYSGLRDDLNLNTEIDLKSFIKNIYSKLHLNETAVYHFTSLNHKVNNYIFSHLPSSLEVSSGRNWRPAEAGWKVVLRFARSDWVWGGQENEPPTPLF